MKPINYYKTWKDIRNAFLTACKRNGHAVTAKNYKAFVHGLRLMHFTNL